MPATTTISPTGDVYVNGVLSGAKWAVNSLTFSFPTDPSYYGANYGSGEPTNRIQGFHANATGRRAIDPCGVFAGHQFHFH